MVERLLYNIVYTNVFNSDNEKSFIKKFIVHDA